MKILHWDEMFHPAFGYQINVLSKYQALQGHEVVIYTSDRIKDHPTFKSFGNDVDIERLDKEYMDKYGIRIIRLPIWGHYSGRVIYRHGYLKKIKQENPDVLFVHTHDTFAGISITWHYKKLGIPMILDNHMLRMASRNKLKELHRLFFRSFVSPYIIKHNLIVIRTQNDDYVNACYGLPQRLTPYLSFGTDTILFHPDSEQRKTFRQVNGISDDAFVIVYTGKLDAAKDGLLLAQAVNKRFDSKKEIVVIIVGNTPTDDYGKRVEKTFESSHNRIIRVPTQNYTDLPRFYQSADLCLFAKQCSLSFFDAQACGLPVVFEDNNINIDRSSYGNGWVFKSGSIDDFRNKIEIAINMDDADYKIMKNNAIDYIRKNFDYRIIATEYTDLMHKEMERQRREEFNEY